MNAPLSGVSLEAEQAEIRTICGLLQRVPKTYRREHGVGTTQLAGGAVAVSIARDTGGFWNRVLGLGLIEPVTAKSVGDAVDALCNQHASSATLQIVAGRRPGDWDEISAARGLKRADDWYKMGCAIDDVACRRTELEVGPVGPGQHLAAAQLLGGVFGFPPAETPALVEPSLRAGDLRMFGAWSDGRLVASALLFVAGPIAHLYGAATLPEYRNRGAQSALIGIRATAARQLGCERLIFETGVPAPGERNPSFSAARGAGLRVLHIRENWWWSR